jgi:diguanylate cyclase (GGDEF)-like protein
VSAEMLAPLPKDISLDRRATSVPCRFQWLAFLVASLAAAIVLVSMVVIPQWLSKQARWEALRTHVGEIGKVAASVVDGDLHRKLLDPANYSADLYSRALEPLVRFHSADPNIFYLYTMVDRGGVAYFVLDTAASPDLRTKNKLRPSAYMERFDLREEYKDDWLQQIAAGKTYVNHTFEQDDYGEFLSATSPIYDSKGRYSGFVGVDFDLQYYFAREARFRVIAIGSLIAALIGAVVIGCLVALYYSAMHGRIQQLYDISIRDSLTGLLNRRGAIDTIGKSLARHQASNAMLLVDVDSLKMINDLRGHATGDAVIALTAEAVGGGIRDGDVCARFGGDEFLIFAPGCDLDEATKIAKRIMGRLSGQSMPLAGAKFTVSIGIVVQDGAHADFDRMYRDADAALYKGREDGKSRIGVFTPSDADGSHSDSELSKQSQRYAVPFGSR